MIVQLGSAQLDTLLPVVPNPPRETVVWLDVGVVRSLEELDELRLLLLRLLLELDDDDRHVTGSPRSLMQFFSPGVMAAATAAPAVPARSSFMAVERLMAPLPQRTMVGG